MRATDDDFARARRALRQVDAEVDLARLRALTAERDRPGTSPLPPDESLADGDAALGVEILRPGQRPALPRRRAAAWALAATVALLCGAGVGVAALWPGTGATTPGSQLPAPPVPATSPETSPEPATGTGPSTAPTECAPARPVPSAAPGPATTGPAADEMPSDTCGATPAPSDPAGPAEP